MRRKTIDRGHEYHLGRKETGEELSLSGWMQMHGLMEWRRSTPRAGYRSSISELLTE